MEVQLHAAGATLAQPALRQKRTMAVVAKDSQQFAGDVPILIHCCSNAPIAADILEGQHRTVAADAARVTTPATASSKIRRVDDIAVCLQVEAKTDAG